MSYVTNKNNKCTAELNKITLACARTSTYEITNGKAIRVITVMLHMQIRKRNTFFLFDNIILVVVPGSKNDLQYLPNNNIEMMMIVNRCNTINNKISLRANREIKYPIKPIIAIVADKRS